MKHDGLTISVSFERENNEWIFQSYDIDGKQFRLTKKAIAEIVFHAVKDFPQDRSLATKLRNMILLAEVAKEQEKMRDLVKQTEKK